MNDQQFNEKVSQDADMVIEDLNTLMGDGVSKFNQEFQKLTGDAKETMVSAVTAIKKDVGEGLIQFNAKAQEVADKVPGGLGEKAARYPWVAISIALAAGLLLGGFLKPAR